MCARETDKLLTHELALFSFFITGSYQPSTMPDEGGIAVTGCH